MFPSIPVSLIIPVILAVAFQAGEVRTYRIAPDHSLTAATYIKKGMPAYDRDWSGQDYVQAAKVLQAVAGLDATQLPRYGSPTSGAVFARIVSHDNFGLFGIGILNQQQSFTAASALLQGLGQITIVYASATTQEKVFDSELVELMRYVLEVSREVAHLAEAFIASLPANDPDHDARLKGREQMRQGMARVVFGCLDTLAERETYRSSELVRLAQTLETTVPAIFSFLPPGAQQELSVRIQRMIEQEPASIIKEGLTRLAAALNRLKAG